MSLPERIERDLAQARPPDPLRAEADRAAVRILARLAVREAGTDAEGVRPPRRRFLRLVATAAAVLVAVLLWPREAAHDAGTPATIGDTTTTHGPDVVAETTPAEDPLWRLAREAVGGDALARARLRDRGREGRRALLELAASGGAEAPRALAVLRTFGSLRGPREVERIAELAYDARLRTEAVPLLAADLGVTGARHLGRLLEQDADAEAIAIEALERVARRGRRQAALEALRRGAAAGRVGAAAAALRLGGAAELRSVLAALPPPLRTAPALADAIRTGPRTLRGRALHLAARGDAAALALAARARLSGAVALLEDRAHEAPRERAERAVALLAEVDTPRAWVALGRARDGIAKDAALAVLVSSREETLDGLVEIALRRSRDAAPALAALAAAGAPGLERLRELARSPAVASEVVAAMAQATAPRASRTLAELATRPARRFEVVAALAARLTAGDESAGSALLALARGGLMRPALRALAGCGEAGIRWLKEAEHEPELRRRAREWLRRVGGAASTRSSATPSAI